MFEARYAARLMGAAVFFLAVLPFLTAWRIGPQGGWMIESMTVFAALLWVVSGGLVGGGRGTFAGAPLYCLLLAVFWAVQARLVPTVYVEMSDLTAAVWLAMALMAWMCRRTAALIGQEAAAVLLARALLAGALLQGAVCVLQFAGADNLPGILRAPGDYFVYGQLGQRNHLGHYLMWGILALSYLWARGRLRPQRAWAAAGFLLGVMGLVTSRTVLLYVLVLAAVLPFFYWRGEAESRRWCRIAGILVFGVLMAQLSVLPLLSLWLPDGVQASGIAKMALGQTASSGRAAEWAKAWAVFLNHPVLGTGWLGYAHEAFVLQGEVFRSYDRAVLFTHSHNSYLQILAEMGLVGGLLVFGGLWRLLSGSLKRGSTPASLWLFCMAAVSLCHSLLEYPLWYGYFLAPFVLALALITPPPAAEPTRMGRQAAWAGGALALVMAALTAYYAAAYFTLAHAYGRPTDIWPQERQIARLREIERDDYFLRYYAHMGLLRKVDGMQRPLPDWGREAAMRAPLLRPYANTAVRAWYLDAAGRRSEADGWLRQLGYYYPESLSGYLKTLRGQGRHDAASALYGQCLHYRNLSDGQADCGGDLPNAPASAYLPQTVPAAPSGR